MAWLESLKSSSAARLVSSAAREIFSESTSEIEDPVADLRNSRSRIAELERLVSDYKSEAQIKELIAEITLWRGEPEGECLPPSVSNHVSPERSDAALISKTLFSTFFTLTLQVRVMHGTGEAVNESVNTPALGGVSDVGDMDIDGYNSESVESRFIRIREALSSAVSLLPPLASDHAVMEWPPRQPEAQVAVLVAAEAASRQELMMTRAYIDQLQCPLPSPLPCNGAELYSNEVTTDPIGAALDRSIGPVSTSALSQHQSPLRLVHVCKLLEKTLISCAKFLRGECRLADFDEDVSPLIQVEEHYADIVEMLRSAFASTPLERALKEICHQLEACGEVIDIADVNSPTVLRLCELLSKRKDPPRDFLLNSKGKVEKDDQKIVDKFNNLVEKLEYKDALSAAILCILNDIETGSESFDSTAYKLDVDGLNIVNRLGAALFTKSAAACVSQLEKESIEGIRNRITSVDKTDLVPELKAALSCLDTLFNVIDDCRNDLTETVSTEAIRRKVSNYTVANALLKLLTLKKIDEGNELFTVLKMIRMMLHEDTSNLTSEQTNLTDSSLSEKANAIINCFAQLSKLAAEHELRDYLIELVNHGNPDPTILNPQNQTIARRLIDMLSHRHQSDSIVISLLEAVVKGVQNNALDGLDERIASSQVDERLLNCLHDLLRSFVNLRTKFAQVERDKVALGQLVRSKHAESQAYHAKLKEVLTERQSNHTDKGEDIAKLMAKIERLELHLLQTEESYTRETVAAEEREASLRAKLGQTEEQLAALQGFVASADEQIGCALEERNVAREACRTFQAELSTFQLSYTNLQKVLNSLEKEKQMEADATAQHFRLENERLQQEIERLRQLVKNLEVEVARLGDVETNNRALQEQLKQHDSRLSEAYSLARHYEERIKVLKGKMKEMAEELDGKLDKSVMKSLLISCMKLPPAKRPEAFRSLGSVLNFTSEDYDLLGFNEPIAKNWKELFWRSDASTVEKSLKSEQSFIELLANFLEKESAPPSQIRLPTDYLRRNSTGVDTDCKISQGYRNSASIIQHRLSSPHLTPCEQVASPKKANASNNPLISGLPIAKSPSAMN
ncbi:unnamed protein product [Hydatigera taeniaeformis]|uniref:GRIP domain-containing protein n=1 Tax=Hydatigena taeniaeformis TaxID=6205 RepID=A0A0R3X2D5_HYDTA|nr:unnamed protein product [Hydatigera taeniaeformis]